MAAAPQSKDATFDTVWAKSLRIVNDAGRRQVSLETDEDGGVLRVNNAEGRLIERIP